MKKITISIMFISLILTSCNKDMHQLTDGAWITQIYGNDVNDGDSIYVEAGLTFISFDQDNILEPAGTVKLIGKGSIIYLINDDNFGLVSADGRNVPAVIESFSDFKAAGTWTIDADKVIVEWNTDSIVVDGDLGNCINLDEVSASKFMLNYGTVIAQRSADSHSQVLNVVNDWLKQRSKLTFNDKKNEWNAIIDGQEKPVLWKIKSNDSVK